MDFPRFELTTYFSQAAALVREHTIVLWWLVFISLCNSLVTFFAESEIAQLLAIISFILSLCSTPVIYGIYYELIEDTYTSIPQIIRSYTLPYLWLLVRMYVPVIFLAWVPVLLSPQAAGGGIFHTLLVSFSLIYLYVIPFYYFTGQQYGSISRGITFLLKTFGPSTPLILVVLLLESSLLLIQYNKPELLEFNRSLFILLDFSTYIFASVIDFMIFIVLILILKNEVGTNTLN